MALRTVDTTYSKLLSRMVIRSLRTFVTFCSNFESGIQTNDSDLDSEGKKNRAFNCFLEEGPASPCKVKHEEEVDEEKYPGIYYDESDPRQMMMRNTCDRLQWFTNRTDAADVESNAFSTDEPIKGPGILEHAEIALCIKKGMPPKSDLSGFKHLFLVEKHNIILENYGLYKKGNTDWNVAGGSKLRYISIEDFMWWFYRIPGKYNKGIYNYMFKQQIYVLENCPFTLLEHPVTICSWQAPFDGWYKLNVSGFFKENLDGTIEASCGQVLRDSWGMVLERFHKPLPDATSRDEAFILGVHHGIYEILQRRSEAKNIILEIDHKIIFNVLSRFQHLQFDYMELYWEIFTLLSKFDKYKISFRYSQGNGLAKRVAYIASHLTVGQSFPIGDRGYETQVKCDQWKIPRYEIVLEKKE